MRIICVSLLVSLMSCTIVSAGAWTQPEGKGQAIVTLAYSFANDAFDDDGETVAIEAFKKFELRGFAEYGLTDWATLVFQPELRLKDQGDDSSDGLGRFDVGLRTRFWHSDFAVASFEGSVSAPGQSRDADLAPLNGGDTDWEIEARALYGRGFEFLSRNGFLDVQLGLRHRFSDPADEVLFDLTLGLDLTARTQAILQSFNRVSVGSARLPFTETQDHKIAFSTVRHLGERWSLQAGTQITLAGRNVLREQGVFLSVWHSF